MKQVIHIVLFKGRLATLDFFVDRFIDYCVKNGIDHYVVDTNKPETYCSAAFDSFIEQPDCVMFTFNNIGISLTAGEENIWKKNNIPVYDFIVDPPRAFKNVLLKPECDIRVISLDKNRNDFIREFYPEIKRVYFMAAGGADMYSGKLLKDRKLDVIYMGSCQAKDQNYPPISFLDDEGLGMYQSVIPRMAQEPQYTTEQAIRLYFEENGIKLSHEQLFEVLLKAAQPIENTIRRFFKLQGIQALDQMGIKVNIWGNDWEDDEIVFSDNIQIHGFISPDEVLQLCGNAKISLVFMGWQKRGCSEKNFDSMLNGALCVTDTTEYLNAHYRDGYNIVYFDLHNMDQMAADIKYLLEHLDVAQTIADRGYETALKYDSWDVRFDEIIKIMKEN